MLDSGFPRNQNMAQTVIALVCDCDETLAPDTTAQLLSHFGIDAERFYKEQSGKLVDAGYDPPLAYMNEILKMSQKRGPLSALTRAKIEEIGKSLQFYPGVPEVFTELASEVHTTYAEFGVRLETYVITGGIADLIKASPLGGAVRKIWGCDFAYAADGRLSAIKNVVSFTEKTRFLFNIEKGLVDAEYDNRPYEVNSPIEQSERRVPIRNMVYLGDGPSDIPCMSIIQKLGEAYGTVIGILNKRKPYQTWALGFGRRASITIPPNFKRDAEYGGFDHLREAVIQIANRIQNEVRTRGRGHAPKY
jgi:hypothetical protein